MFSHKECLTLLVILGRWIACIRHGFDTKIDGRGCHYGVAVLRHHFVTTSFSKNINGEGWHVTVGEKTISVCTAGTAAFTDVSKPCA